ncbi:MAG TPA: hypothetical protein PLR59_10515, partial [Brevundimonas sp.]|nr:hypothetical protein [Brevundimonas sp.]
MLAGLAAGNRKVNADRLALSGLDERVDGIGHTVANRPPGHNTVKVIGVLKVEDFNRVPGCGRRFDILCHQGSQFGPDQELAYAKRQVFLWCGGAVGVRAFLGRAPHEPHDHRLAADRLIHADQGRQRARAVDGRHGQGRQGRGSETGVGPGFAGSTFTTPPMIEFIERWGVLPSNPKSAE